MLLLLSIALLPMLFFIGLVTSYEDIKQGKIRNKWILLGLGWGLGVFLLLLFWRFIATPVTDFFYFQILRLPADSPLTVYTYNLSFLWKSLINFVCALVAGFALWRFNSWAAGDAKLFLVYALLIPLFYYERSYLPVFPAFVLLVNIFCVFLIYLSASIVLYLGRVFFWRLASFFSGLMEAAPDKQLKKIIWSVSWRQVGRMITGLGLGMILPLFIMLAASFFQEPLKKYLFIDLAAWMPFIFATLIIFNKIMSAVTKRRWLLISLAVFSLAICLYGLVVDYRGALPKIYGALASMVVFAVLFSVFQGLMNFYFKKNHCRKIALSELAPGMMIDPSLWRELRLMDGESDKFKALDEEQVRKVRENFAGRKIDTIEVFKSSFFAPWVFAGALATLVLKGSLLAVILKMLN